MPYIDFKRRSNFDNAVDIIVDNLGTTFTNTEAGRIEDFDKNKAKGDLNYVIFTIARKYLKKHGMSYSSLNDIIGAIECSKLELNRRIIGPYEDEAIKRNGDV